MRANRASSTLLAAALLLGACDDTNHVSAVDYTVSEFPSSGKYPWSCLPNGMIDGPGAASIDWTTGTPLVAYITAQYERACGGWFGAPCPDPQIVPAALDASTWRIAAGPEPGSTLGPNARYLEALAAGEGGIAVTAMGKAFAPLRVHDRAPAALRFFRVDGELGAVTLTPITRLVLAPAASARVVPRLEDGAGARLCGFPRMTATASGVTVAPDDMNPDGRANGPLRVTAMSAPGEVRFVYGAVAGTLPVDVL